MKTQPVSQPTNNGNTQRCRTTWRRTVPDERAGCARRRDGGVSLHQRRVCELFQFTTSTHTLPFHLRSTCRHQLKTGYNLQPPTHNYWSTFKVIVPYATTTKCTWIIQYRLYEARTNI